jgi:MFS family permease
VLILGVALGLIAGLLAGGRLDNLIAVRLRLIWLLFLAALLRFGTEFFLVQRIETVEQLRVPLFLTAYGLLLVGLYVNRQRPGIAMAFVGIASNAIAIAANGGYMPIWQPSLAAAGFGLGDVRSPLHTVVPAPLDETFLTHLGFLGDIIPIPVPFLQNVASIGDVFLSAGLAFFLFATVVRSPEDVEHEALAGERARARLGVVVEDPELGPVYVVAPLEVGLTPNLIEAAALERPVMLGGSRAGLQSPSAGALPAADRRRGGLIPDVLERARRHPYVRLSLNGNFTALWTGQLISLFGDRMHQIALAFLVLALTNSPIAVAFVFVAATIPNLLLGPIAGTFVDRWDQKQVMVVSDLLRAAIVLLIPAAALLNILLVYPLVLVLTSVSIFFRPARTAVLPRVVEEDELLTANSATWISETLADVIGYPLAGLFIAFLGASLPLAFWLDAATYVASAVLIATMSIPPQRADVHATEEERAAADELADAELAEPRSALTDWADVEAELAGVPSRPARPRGRFGRFTGEMLEGWRFLRHEPVLLANTLQATVGQFTVGVLLALTPFYARDLLALDTEAGRAFDPTSAYAFLETGIGLGNLVGGFAIGLIGTRLARGRMVIVGYALWGLCTVGLSLTGNFAIALALMLGSGVANMIYVIPSQTLFQERTPVELIGRVVGFRFSLVFGSMTLAMGLSGLIASQVGVAPVIGAFGALTVAAGLSGLLIPAVRNA